MLCCFRFGDVFCDVSWLFVAIFCFSTNVFRSNDVCYVFWGLLMLCVFVSSVVCVLRCVLFGFRFSFFCEVLGVCMCGDGLENTMVGMFLIMEGVVIEVRVFWGVMGCVGVAWFQLYVGNVIRTWICLTEAARGRSEHAS